MLIGALKTLAKGTPMKLRSIALVLASALTIAFTSAAQAQSGFYATFEAQQFTQEGVYTHPLPGSMDIDRPWLFGPAYGVYYDVTRLPHVLILKGGPLKTGPVVIGIDAHGDTLRWAEYGSTFNRQDGVFSLRVANKSPIKGTTFYAQGGFGIGHTKVPNRLHYSNNLVYQFGFGADRPIRKHIDWRIVEATAGFHQNYSTGYSPSGLGANQSNYLVTVGTGLVFHLH
jgi:hypothetical protein